MLNSNFKKTLKKIWWFIWEDDSILSWIVNIVIAYILIKFMILPGIGLLFQTSHPVVAVVSGSMEHKIVYSTNYGSYQMCDQLYEEKSSVNFDKFWDECGEFYREYDINKIDFEKFKFKNGFNTGDIMALFGTKPKNIKVGDVIVFTDGSINPREPIIHRVIKIIEQDGKYYFSTKGDHNEGTLGKIETNISEDRVIGRAVFRIPYFGYIKIWFVEILRILNLTFVEKLFS